MEKHILLTNSERTLKSCLLDVSNYIVAQGQPRPHLRFAGGWVRDKLLGATSEDIDISISSMTGSEFGHFMKAFLDSSESAATLYKKSIIGPLAKIEANPEKSKHLATVTTRFLGLHIDFVNLRKETYSEDSRTPAMEFGTPKEDANRRDATVNALFYNLQTSQVEDFTGRGLEDLGRKVMKTPLPPHETFKDDPLRVLRSIRFASRLGFQIDPDDELAMDDKSIKEGLRLKISRERVRSEVVKMLRGPNPHRALSLIDRLNLYNTIFTDPASKSSQTADTNHWRIAYDQLHTLTTTTKTTTTQLNELSDPIRLIATTLFKDPQDPEEVYLAWMLCCFVPWARVVPTTSETSTAKFPKTMAAKAAREGIRADNKSANVVEGAALNLFDVIKTKANPIEWSDPASTTLERNQLSDNRELHGKALIRWGSHWRSTVIFSLLVQITEAANPSDGQVLLESYATWLSNLTRLGLLDIHQLKPMVSGDLVSRRLGTEPGSWMKKAMEIVLGWQLRNPDESSPEGCIQEIIQRREELGI